MQDLPITVLCSGILKIRRNAASLIEEAELLFANGRSSRAYVLAYTACEELGKIAIVVGMVTRVAGNTHVNWKSFSKRFRSHNSKAIQFLSLGTILPILRDTARGQKIDLVDVEAEVRKNFAAAASTVAERNSGLYCDFEGKNFFAPDERITPDIASRFIALGKQQLEISEIFLGNTVDEVEERLVKYAKRGGAEKIAQILGKFKAEDG